MPRRSRTCPVGLPVHVIQRGHNRQACFATDADFKAYAHWLHQASAKFGVDIHAWVFMSNHVHLLMTPTRNSAVSQSMQSLGRCYVRYFNFRYQRTGTLYESRFRSSIVQTQSYFLACQRYIELNPVRAGMVKDPADYAWSSYRAHAFGIPAEMWKPHPEYLALGASGAIRHSVYRNLVASALDGKLLKEIRLAAQTGLVLGNDRFKDEIRRLTGQRQQHLKRGPKTKL